MDTVITVSGKEYTLDYLFVAVVGGTEKGELLAKGDLYGTVLFELRMKTPDDYYVIDHVGKPVTDTAIIAYMYGETMDWFGKGSAFNVPGGLRRVFDFLQPNGLSLAYAALFQHQLNFLISGDISNPIRDTFFAPDTDANSKKTLILALRFFADALESGKFVHNVFR